MNLTTASLLFIAATVRAFGYLLGFFRTSAEAFRRVFEHIKFFLSSSFSFLPKAFFLLLRHVYLVGLVTVTMYLIGFSIMSLPAAECYGWKCAVVHCPNGYAVETPDGFLPCENFDEYIETKNKELLR